MKIFKLILLFLLVTNIVRGQIINNDFETPRDSLSSLPKDWGAPPIDGYTFSLDNEIKYSGQKSLVIKSSQETDTTKFIPFSQIVKIDIQSLKKITLTAYIRTENVKGNAGLLCLIWDKDDKQIGYSNLELQGTKIIGTNDWKEYKLILIVDNKVKKLVIGGYLAGIGSVWYDNFNIEDREISKEPPSHYVKKYSKKFNKIVKNNSIYSDSLNWNTINADIKILSKGLKTANDAHILSNYVLSKLIEVGDHHSSFMNKTIVKKIALQNLDRRQPFAKLLENQVGYIYVPGFISTNDTISINFANKIQTLIKDLDTKNIITGWIVDLRENTGGSLYPMIAGLGPLIGEGTLGNFIYPKSNTTSKWYYSNGTAGIGNKKNLNIKEPYTLKNSNTKIAVLIGSTTASSGEMTTISFIGKSNVKLIGQPSGGYTTGNKSFNLSDGSLLNLARSFVSDRNNKKYLNVIFPDILVDEKDKNITILIAQKWLNEK